MRAGGEARGGGDADQEEEETEARRARFLSKDGTRPRVVGQDEGDEEKSSRLHSARGAEEGLPAAGLPARVRACLRLHSALRLSQSLSTVHRLLYTFPPLHAFLQVNHVRVYTQNQRRICMGFAGIPWKKKMEETLRRVQLSPLFLAGNFPSSEGNHGDRVPSCFMIHSSPRDWTISQIVGRNFMAYGEGRGAVCTSAVWIESHGPFQLLLLPYCLFRFAFWEKERKGKESSLSRFDENKTRDKRPLGRCKLESE